MTGNTDDHHATLKRSCGEPIVPGESLAPSLRHELVVRARDVAGREKAVLHALVMRVDKAEWTCYPSQKRLAEESGFCERAVRTSIAELEALGLVAKAGQRRTLVYRVHFDKLASLALARRGTEDQRGRHELPVEPAQDADQQRQVTEASNRDVGGGGVGAHQESADRAHALDEEISRVCGIVGAGVLERARAEERLAWFLLAEINTATKKVRNPAGYLMAGLKAGRNMPENFRTPPERQAAARARSEREVRDREARRTADAAREVQVARERQDDHHLRERLGALPPEELATACRIAIGNLGPLYSHLQPEDAVGSALPRARLVRREITAVLKGGGGRPSLRPRRDGDAGLTALPAESSSTAVGDQPMRSA